MAKQSKLNNLELVHLNIWLNLLQNKGNRVCDRWIDQKTGYYNFKKDSYKQFLNHVEQFGVHQTFVTILDVNGQYNPDNCCWKIEKQDLKNHPYIPKTVKKKAKILNLKDYKKIKKR